MDFYADLHKKVLNFNNEGHDEDKTSVTARRKIVKKQQNIISKPRKNSGKVEMILKSDFKGKINVFRLQ